MPGFANGPGLPPQMFAPAGPSRVQRYLAEGPPAQPAQGPAPGGGAPRAPATAKADLDLLGNMPLPAEPGARKLAAAQASTAGQAAMSVAEARAAHAADASGADHDARIWLERGLKAEEAGKASVAAIYFRMAAERATGDVQKQALARLEALKAPGARR